MTLALTTVFALLTIALWGAVAGLSMSGAARRAILPHWAVGAAASIMGTATLGSLYLSEVAGYVPCELCWVQRIFAYPMAVLFAVAAVRRRRDVWAYAVPLAAIGLATSVWHVIVQRLPAAGAACDPLNPCSAIWVERFGIITIPVMAGTAFLSVLALAWTQRGRTAGQATTTSVSDIERTPVDEQH